MSGHLLVRRAGPGATIQDGGRRGYLRFGVTPAGPMDWAAFRTVNLALGNAAEVAAVEIALGGFEVECVEAPVVVAYGGGAFVWSRQATALPAAARLTLVPGERLAVRAGPAGAWTYLAVRGGLDAPLAMGSRATHTRSAIGGLDGRMLRAGDTLAAPPGEKHGSVDDAVFTAPWLAPASTPLRVVLGPQDDYFSEAGIGTFFSAPFTLTAAADRMAYKLQGARIEHARGFNIVSDGVALGAVQVSGDGMPLVLMADRQPTGGYPKIGHIIRADIGRLAQRRPGEICRFAPIDVTAARSALFALENDVTTVRHRLQPLRPALTSEMLLAANLVDGVADGLAGLD